MDKKEKAALALERKIENAIERGEFTPNFGYLNDVTFTDGGPRVEIGPCGCALAAAASVNGLVGWAFGTGLAWYLAWTLHMSDEDCSALESHRAPAFPGNPCYAVGQRLHRFHPAMAWAAAKKESAPGLRPAMEVATEAVAAWGSGTGDDYDLVAAVAALIERVRGERT